MIGNSTIIRRSSRIQNDLANCRISHRGGLDNSKTALGGYYNIITEGILRKLAGNYSGPYAADPTALQESRGPRWRYLVVAEGAGSLAGGCCGRQ